MEKHFVSNKYTLDNFPKGVLRIFWDFWFYFAYLKSSRSSKISNRSWKIPYMIEPRPSPTYIERVTEACMKNCRRRCSLMQHRWPASSDNRRSISFEWFNGSRIGLRSVVERWTSRHTSKREEEVFEKQILWGKHRTKPIRNSTIRILHS